MVSPHRLPQKSGNYGNMSKGLSWKKAHSARKHLYFIRNPGSVSRILNSEISAWCIEISAWCIYISVWCIDISAWYIGIPVRCIEIYAWCIKISAWCLKIYVWCIEIPAWCIEISVCYINIPAWCIERSAWCIETCRVEHPLCRAAGELRIQCTIPASPLVDDQCFT